MTIFLIAPEHTSQDEFDRICAFMSEHKERSYFVMSHGFQVIETRENIGAEAVLSQICQHCGTKYLGTKIIHCAKCGGEVVEVECPKIS